MEKVNIDDIELVLTEPVKQELEWIGQEELVEQILASWLVASEKDLPLCPRLIGKPGVGKTTLACFAARAAGLESYIHQCTVDTRPEDLLVTPVLSREGKISYHACPLVSAMIRGGAVLLDEANRMSEKSWASLAPLLDHRRYVESIVAGIRIPAHPKFRACITMNEDASTYEIPDYMLSRIQPAVSVEFPEKEEELRILKYHLPFAAEEILDMTVRFLEDAHGHGLGYSTRDGINIARFAVKIELRERQRGVPERETTSAKDRFARSVRKILGEDAFDLKEKAMEGSPQQLVDLQDFFAALEDMDVDDATPPADPEKPKRKGRGRKPRPKPGEGPSLDDEAMDEPF